MCMAFSCLRDFDRELAVVSDKFLVRYDFFMAGFRHWLGSGSTGVLGLPVRLDRERLDSCGELAFWLVT